MDTMKMVAEIKSVCATLETEKKNLSTRLQKIEAELSSYYNAVESLMATVTDAEPSAKHPKTWSRKAVYLELDGVRKSVPEWARSCGISPNALRYRLNAGWSLRDAITKSATDQHSTAIRKKKMKAGKVFMYDAHNNVIRQYSGIGDASRELNLPVSTVEKIIDKMGKEDQIRVRNYYLAYAG